MPNQSNGDVQPLGCLWDNKKSHVHTTKSKKGASLFPCSSSAHDLRHLELEKENEDEISPRGVLENCFKDFEPPHPPESETTCSSYRGQSHSHWTNFFKHLKKKSFKRLASFPPFGVPKISRWRSKSSRRDAVFSNLCSLNSLVNFTLSDLKKATKNFSHENLIGRGGFAEVYQGCLSHAKLIAVKKMTKGTMDEKTVGFLTELGIIAHVDHPNIAKLIGTCVEGGMHLVFELSPLGSLGSLLHGPKKDKLDWNKRHKIVLGIADGLLYLHENCHRRIIHRDIKSENILLTENFEPQICDFGLAKWLPQQWTHYNASKFEGTFGYFAPEYCMHGIVDEKTDVFSFGVLLLEIITGRPALDHLQQSVVIWAKPLLDANHIKDLVDPSLRDNYDQAQMGCLVLTASMCVERSPIFRPCMNQVVTLLRGDNGFLESKRARQRRPFQRTYSEELLDVQEYNSTKYLRDLNRHRQLALDS